MAQMARLHAALDGLRTYLTGLFEADWSRLGLLRHRAWLGSGALPRRPTAGRMGASMGDDAMGQPSIHAATG